MHPQPASDLPSGQTVPGQGGDLVDLVRVYRRGCSSPGTLADDAGAFVAGHPAADPPRVSGGERIIEAGTTYGAALACGERAGCTSTVGELTDVGWVEVV